MTIADDEGNPWRWIGTVQVGQPCELIIADRFGPIELNGAHFLNDDGQWFRMDPPRRLNVRPVAWRYAMKETGK